MAKETKKQEELVNVAEVVSKSEAFLTKNKNAIVGGIVAVVVIIAAVPLVGTLVAVWKNTYVTKKAEAQKRVLERNGLK